MANYQEIISKATDARKNAYCPYSGFSVGACLVCSDGKMYTGCNVENASYGETVCAERVAFLKAVSDGKRGFCAIAIVGGKGEITDFTYPCGSCRQVLSELADSGLEIVLFNGSEHKICTLGQLFPNSFGSKDIK